MPGARLGVAAQGPSYTRRMLILGSHDGRIAARFATPGRSIVSADAGFAFARASSGVQCDEDRLPFGDASFDLVISAGVLDSVNDLPGALALIRRVLRPDGLFLGAFAGAGSLAWLKSALLAADSLASGGVAARPWTGSAAGRSQPS